jgi:hypothetical protein
MQDALPNLNGLLLRGTSLYEEKALKVLAENDYNYEWAKFAILNPTVACMPERRARFEKACKDDPTLLKRTVEEAIVDLRGCK